MRDIGREVGVSAVTVSKALAGKPGMSEGMRGKIIETAERMGYEYPGADKKPGARNLDVGVLVPEAYFDTNSFYTGIYKKLVQRLTDEGHYSVMELISRDEEERLAVPKLIGNQRVNGLILLGQPRKEYYRMIARQGIPVVFLDFYDEQASADAVVGDNSYGCYRLTSHLIKNGHTRIAFVGNIRATSSIMDRFLGYARAMLAHNLPAREDWVIRDRDQDNHLVSRMKLPEDMPTAFVCNCDLVARRLINQLEAEGYRVPEDVSVTGFDDFEQEPSAGPGISTFRVDTYSMADLAVGILEERCAGERKPFGRTVVGGQPVYRESEKPLEKASF